MEKYDVVEESEAQTSQKAHEKEGPHSSAVKEEPREEGTHSSAEKQPYRMVSEPLEEGTRAALNDRHAGRDGQRRHEPRGGGTLSPVAQRVRGKQEAPGEGKLAVAAQQRERMQNEPREGGARAAPNDCDPRRDGHETLGKVGAHDQTAEGDKSMDQKLDELLNQGLEQLPRQEARGAADEEGSAQPSTPTELLQQVPKRGAATDVTPEPRPKRLSEA